MSNLSFSRSDFFEQIVDTDTDMVTSHAAKVAKPSLPLVAKGSPEQRDLDGMPDKLMFKAQGLLPGSYAARGNAGQCGHVQDSSAAGNLYQPRVPTGLRRGFLLGQRTKAMDLVVESPPLFTAGFGDTGHMPGSDGKAWHEKAFPVPDAVTFKAGNLVGPSSTSFWDALVGPESLVENEAQQLQTAASEALVPRGTVWAVSGSVA